MEKMKQNKSKILIMDSGVGGISVLRESLNLTPNADYIYFADYKSMPYGNKEEAVIRKTVIQNALYLNARFNPSIIVLACNTATAIAIGTLRNIIKDKIVIGTEPAIMVAKNEGSKSPLLLATQNTIRYSRIVRDFKQQNPNFTLLPLKNLASKIEKNLDSLDLISKSLVQKLNLFKFDSLVLGCTHYVFLKPYLSNLLNCPIYDGNLGVAERICSQALTSKKQGTLKVLTNDNKYKSRLYDAFTILNKEVR